MNYDYFKQLEYVVEMGSLPKKRRVRCKSLNRAFVDEEGLNFLSNGIKSMFADP